MIKELPEKQRQILEFIKSQHNKTGVYPSVREIAAHMNFASTNTVDYHLRRLQRAGVLERDERRARSFAMPGAKRRAAKFTQFPLAQEPAPIPIVGKVAAGAPILAEQNYDGMVNFRTFFHVDERTFALRVQGDSMVDAGIVDGDLVIVRQQGAVENGEIGVALVGDEATVKRIYDEGARWRLEPENKTLKPIFVKKEEKAFAIAGKVVGVIRRI